MRGPRYRDRIAAGRELAEHLGHFAGREDVVVLGLPRGGVPVAAEVATALGAPLDVFLVRKVGVPGHAELAMGAIAEGGVRVVNDDVVRQLGIDEAAIERVAAAEGEELDRRREVYRQGRSPQPVDGRVVIVVDDGLATGATMRAALLALREMAPARIVMAVPAAPPSTCVELGAIADEVVCPYQPEPFLAVGYAYDDFSPTTDDEVRRLLG